MKNAEPIKVVDDRLYFPVYVGGQVVAYAPAATHPDFNGAAATGWGPMTTHAALRQVADKLLAAHGDAEFYRRHGPEHGIDDHQEKLDSAEREFAAARQDLEAVLV